MGAGGMKEPVRALREDFDRELTAAGDASALQALRDRYLGRKAGVITALMKSLGSLGPAERKDAGEHLHQRRAQGEGGLDPARDRAPSHSTQHRLARERVDITLPGRV